MSEVGSNPVIADVRRMTALAPKADFDLRSCDVADVPQAAVSSCSKKICTDCSIYSTTSSATTQVTGNFEVEKSCSFQVDDKFVFYRLPIGRSVGFAPFKILAT